MLYQTPNPFSTFNFIPSFLSYSSSISTLQTTSSLPLSKVDTEMDCIEGALKTSLRKDSTVKLSPQTFMEDLNVQIGTPCEDFLFVDNLLDFSHVEQQQDEEEPKQQQHKEGEGEDEDEGSACVSPHKSYEICNLSLKDEFLSLPTSDLSVPEDVADLEWLSHFVEDSFSEFPTTTTMRENPKTFFAVKEPKPLNPVYIQPCFKTPVPAKARSKRTRSGIRVWSLGSRCFTESSSSSTSSTSSSSSPTSTLLNYADLVQNLDQVCSPPKKPKKRVSLHGSVQTPRRCSHCGVQKTPQWRTGPLGAKTLCNACGVRFKSGRLLPEYRPACSPTFKTELHSNHHRKVLEMRRNKEDTGGVETGFAPPPVVPTF